MEARPRHFIAVSLKAQQVCSPVNVTEPVDKNAVIILNTDNECTSSTVRDRTTEVMLKKSPVLLKKFKASILPHEAPVKGDGLSEKRLQRRRNSRDGIHSKSCCH